MADLHLVTGYKGSAHITAANQGLFNASSIGGGDYVFSTGGMFNAQILSNNTVSIGEGCLMMNGRFVTFDRGSTFQATIANGTSGMYRNDLIMIRYTRNITTGVESVQWRVVTGTATTGTPTDPTDYVDGDILDEEITRDMLMYRVRLNGLTIERVDPLFQVLAPMADFQHGFYKQNLLINGDFQCNQRGEATYRTTSTKYTVDMWRGFGVAVQKLNEGVTVKGITESVQGYFTQFIQLGKLKTTVYTISAMADDKICTFTVAPGATAKEKDFGTFKISALTTSTWDDTLNDYNNKLKINILPVGTNSITFKYIDVFEGRVAYPHVKEDYATALMRCKQYVQAGVGVSPVFGASDVGDFRIGISFSEMSSVPTLESCLWSYLGNDEGDFDWESGDKSKFTVLEVSKNFLQGRVKGDFEMAPLAYGVRFSYLLTCEHDG